MESILISSKNRVSGSTSECVIRSNDYLKGCYKVQNIISTNTIYLIEQDKHNQFKINNELFTINNGSYDINSLITAKQNLLNTKFGVNAYNVGINAITGKITIVNSSNTTFSMEFSNNLHIVMGFSDTTYSGASNYTGSEIIDVLNLSIGIKIDEVCTTNIYNFSYNGINSTLYFPFNCNFGQSRELKFSDLPQTVRFDNATNKLTFSFINLTNGNKINLNGSDWVILLCKI
jgi:hypothetical protein